MVKSAYPFIIGALIVAVGCGLFRIPALRAIAVIAVLAALFVAFFFRDPARAVIQNRECIYAAGDGVVMEVSAAEHADFGRCQVVKIFLSIFDVHLQRAPIAGVVQSVTLTRGAFKAAYKKEASEVNERTMIIIKGTGMTVGVAQITGFIARRIECWVKVDEGVGQGQKIGFIRFGSQVDMYLPFGAEMLVKPGDRVRAGLDTVALFRGVSTI